MENEDSIYVYIGEMIRNYRIGLGLTQEYLAEELGVNANEVSRWETAKYKPSVSDLKKLADIFHVSVSVFFKEDFSRDLKDCLRECRSIFESAKYFYPHKPVGIVGKIDKLIGAK